VAEAEPRKLTEKLVGKGARYAFQGQKSLKVGKKRYAYRGTGDEKLDRTLTRGDKRWKKVSTRKEKIRYYNMSDISYLRKRGWELTDPCRSLVQAKAFKKGGYQDSDAMIIRTGKRGDVFPVSHSNKTQA
jgi:hypothetical protein